MRRFHVTSRRTRTRPNLPLCVLAAAAMVSPVTAPPALAATDPDIDPAMPLEVEIESSAVDGLRLVSAELWRHETAEGLPYLRVEYEVINEGDEPVLGHRSRLGLGEVVAASGDFGFLEPGQSAHFAFLALGQGVQGLPPSPGAATLSLVGATLSSATLNDCRIALTEAECQLRAGFLDPLCNGKCVSSGAAGGRAICLGPYCGRDRWGNQCCTWEPFCDCQGRMEATLTEAMFEDLLDPFDPLLQPLVDNPPWVEVKPLDRP